MPLTPSPGFAGGGLLTSAFPLAHPVIIFNGQSFLLAGTPRFRKGCTREQSSLMCSPIRYQGWAQRQAPQPVRLPVGLSSHKDQGFLSTLGLHVGAGKQMSGVL